MDSFLIAFIIILFYIFILFIFRYLSIGRKKSCEKCNNCCPDCSSALNRVRRTNRDRIINKLTFSIFDNRRYTCTECGWEGLRWEDQYKSKNN